MTSEPPRDFAITTASASSRARRASTPEISWSGSPGTTAAVGVAIASAPNNQQITDNVQSELEKSFGSATDVAAQYPQYSNQIIAAARSSFLDGADWAYLAGIVAIVVGAALVFFCFPRRDDEVEMLARYSVEDAPT